MLPGQLSLTQSPRRLQIKWKKEGETNSMSRQSDGAKYVVGYRTRFSCLHSILTSALVASSRIKTFGFATRTRATGICMI